MLLYEIQPPNNIIKLPQEMHGREEVFDVVAWFENEPFSFKAFFNNTDWWIFLYTCKEKICFYLLQVY